MRGQVLERTDDLFLGRVREVDDAVAVHLQIEVSGREQRVAEIDRGLRRVARAGRSDAAALERDPRG